MALLLGPGSSARPPSRRTPVSYPENRAPNPDNPSSSSRAARTPRPPRRTKSLSRRGAEPAEMTAQTHREQRHAARVSWHQGKHRGTRADRCTQRATGVRGAESDGPTFCRMLERRLHTLTINHSIECLNDSRTCTGAGQSRPGAHGPTAAHSAQLVSEAPRVIVQHSTEC